jgi:hypothetical protein
MSDRYGLEVFNGMGLRELGGNTHTLKVVDTITVNAEKEIVTTLKTYAARTVFFFFKVGTAPIVSRVYEGVYPYSDIVDPSKWYAFGEGNLASVVFSVGTITVLARTRGPVTFSIGKMI